MVKPSEIMSELGQKDADLLASAERVIDDALRREYGNRQEVWVGFDTEWTPRIRKLLIARYGQNGWYVREEHDQRDGSALVFKTGVQRESEVSQ